MSKGVYCCSFLISASGTSCEAHDKNHTCDPAKDAEPNSILRLAASTKKAVVMKLGVASVVYLSGNRSYQHPPAESAQTDATRCINGRAPPTQSAVAALVAVVLHESLMVGKHISLLKQLLSCGPWYWASDGIVAVHNGSRRMGKNKRCIVPLIEAAVVYNSCRYVELHTSVCVGVYCYGSWDAGSCVVFSMY